MTKLITCDICGHLVKKEEIYRCLKCDRVYCSDCMVDSTTICPDCEKK